MSTVLEILKSHYEKKLDMKLENFEIINTLKNEIEHSLRCALKTDLFSQEEIKTYRGDYIFYGKIYEQIKKELEV